VATDELYAAAQQLHRLAIESSQWRAELSAIDSLITADWLTATHGPSSAARAESDLHQAVALMGEIELGARGLEWALDTAAQGYGWADHFAGSLGARFAGELGGLGGLLIPLALGVAPAAGTAGLAGVALSALRDPTTRRPAVGASAISRADTVAAVRAGVMGADDALMAASGVPRPVAQILGDSGLGVVGTATAASALMGVGASAGLFREGQVQVTATHVREAAGPPQGFADRLSRVPDPSQEGGAQVVVEKYSQVGAPDRFEVYISGTVTFDPVASTEPFDLTSNLANAAGHHGGAYESVVEAMRLAGVTESSPVQFTGYSQGGATAAMLAASGEFTTVGLTTFGAPAGQIVVPGSVSAVIVEHTDDVVPALGGTQKNIDAVIVQRDVFGGHDIPETEAVPAHDRRYYAETARLMDAARSDQVTSAATRLNSFITGGATVTITAYTFARLDPGSSGGS
jgi:hypothetical protein